MNGIGPERVNELSEKVVSFYENGFGGSPEGLKYLESRGFSDNEILRRHRIGYADGRLARALPKRGKAIDDLKAMGILLEDGTERFLGCVVTPLTDIDGRIRGFYGINVKDRHEHRLPERPPGLFNIGIIKIYPEIILADSVSDVLAFETAGANNAIGINCSDISEKTIGLFQEHGVRKISVVSTESGRIIGVLKNAGIETVEIKLPSGQSPHRCLLEQGRDKLLSMLAPPVEPNTPPIPEKGKDFPATRTQGGFSVKLGLRTYEVLGLERTKRRMKATVRVEKAGLLHVDTLDFYSSKLRRQFCTELCMKFEEAPEDIEKEIGRLVAVCEGAALLPVEPEVVSPPPLMNTVEKQAAESFGRSPDLMERILADFERCGLVGEENNKLLCYLAMTSRKMDEPLSVMILSSSGAGKSALQDATLAFCPPEDLVKLTSLSAKALFYKERSSLKHKVLAIEEGTGAEEANYAIRNLISSEGLRSEVAVRDPQSGKLTTLSNTVEGPSAVFCTTTDPEVNQETRSRFLVTGIDESREQTRKILELQRKKHSLDGLQEDSGSESVLAVHRNFQRLLKPVKVVNPHASMLSYEDDRLQGRRSQPQYLNLISSIAFLNQMRKDIKSYAASGGNVEYIEVGDEDVALGNRLAAEILGRSLDEVSIPARNLLFTIEAMAGRMAGKDGTAVGEVRFTRRDIREYSGWTRTRTQIHLKELIEMEYVVIDSRRSSGLQFYKLLYCGQGKDGIRFVPGLRLPVKSTTPPADLTRSCAGQGEVRSGKKAQHVENKVQMKG